MSWATEQTAKMNQNEQRAESQRQWAIHVRAVQKEGSPLVFARLAAYLVEQVTELGLGNPHLKISAWKNQGLARIEKATYPRLTLDVKLNQVTCELEITWTEVEAPTARQIEGSESLRLWVDNKGDLYVGDSGDYLSCGNRILERLSAACRA